MTESDCIPLQAQHGGTTSRLHNLQVKCHWHLIRSEALGKLLLFAFLIGCAIAPGTDRQNILQSWRQEFNSCIRLMTNVHCTADTVADVRRRIGRLRNDILATENHLLSSDEVNEFCNILNTTLNEIALHRLHSDAASLAFQIPMETSNLPGRPRYAIQQEQLNLFITCRFRQVTMANMLGVSARTVSRRLRLFGIPTIPYVQISNDELDNCVRQVITFNRLIGPNTVKVHLQNDGVHVPRWRVREAMQRIDPVGFAVRKTRRIPRRRYNVPGPNSLWHMDGNHKLITWRLIVHAAVDGDTRTVVFVNIAPNNLAATVFSGFMDAVANYGIPSRLRCDGGTENVRVAHFMEQYRGLNRGSVIIASSVHNQRIEKLWNDVWRGTVNQFYDLFCFMERERILDAGNEAHLYALHYIFIPRIRQSLKKFQEYWNNHGIRTAGHVTPHQMFVAHSLEMFHSNHTAIRDIFSDAANAEMNEAIHDPRFTAAAIRIPPIPQLLTDQQLQYLRQQVDPLANSESDDNVGIQLYLRALLVIRSFDRRQ